MEPLPPVRQGEVTRIGDAPSVFRSPIPATPPPEVERALDRAAGVMSELGRRNIIVALDSTVGGRLRVMLRHPGELVGEEISQLALLSLLDSDNSEVAELTRRAPPPSP